MNEEETDLYYSDGGPPPGSPAEFAAQVQALATDPLRTAAELDIQLGQLAIGYADTLLSGGIRLLPGPWTAPAQMLPCLGCLDGAHARHVSGDGCTCTGECAIARAQLDRILHRGGPDDVARAR